MKTFSTRSSILAGFALALASSLVPSIANAGPGTDYWRSHVAARIAQSVTTPTPKVATPLCTDSRVVGAKRTCNACSMPNYVVQPSSPNRRGPVKSVTVSSSHDCSSGCKVGTAD